MNDSGTLAAVVYQAGFPIDTFLAAIARRLAADGVRLGGVVQENAGAKSSCAAMTLVDLTSRGRFQISQELGSAAAGCRLDPRGLAEAETPLTAMLSADPDLIILNKFGKAEAEGRGLRGILVRAIEREIPILTAVRPPYLEAWERFHGGLAITLPPDPEAVHAWCRAAVRHGAPARRVAASLT